ncbi:MAG TPA: carbon-nitrogen hydrolase family protein [Candidatus Acidoferrales bacterium]|nr:carbon-nitrogen hydrolase family protein [Candidatus Acidoferrales bacterium]
MSARPFVAAAVQAAPVFLDRDATVEKACRLIAEAASRGAKLVVLPETFVPAYPAWVWFLPLTRRPDVALLYRTLVEHAIDVPGPETERLGRAAREAGAWVAIGVNERNAEASHTTLYNTLLLFDDQGALVERRRKLMPTGGERLVWSAGPPVPLVVHDTPLGRLGSLICWENYMPLARFALWEQGAQIHLAPTWDKADAWIASMRHIAREGRVFVVSCCQALHRDQVPDRFPFKDLVPANVSWINSGNSLIADPDGSLLAGPVADREEILLAEIDPGRASGSRWIFDAAGHYNRPDLFTFAQRGAAPPADAARGRPAPPAARAPGRRKAAARPGPSSRTRRRKR